MALGEAVSADRIHIGFFGMRNAGKSSLVNAVLGQELSVVSDVKGTTTDPVTKAMELLPFGPVALTDTAGFGDTTLIGDKVKIYQGVTLGAKSFKADKNGVVLKGGKRHPTIGNGCVIYAGATILGGDTIIGDNCIIGGNVWLTHSLPENSKVYYKEK